MQFWTCTKLMSQSFYERVVLSFHKGLVYISCVLQEWGVYCKNVSFKILVTLIPKEGLTGWALPILVLVWYLLYNIICEDYRLHIYSRYIKIFKYAFLWHGTQLFPEFVIIIGFRMRLFPKWNGTWNSIDLCLVSLRGSVWENQAESESSPIHFFKISMKTDGYKTHNSRLVCITVNGFTY